VEATSIGVTSYCFKLNLFQTDWQYFRQLGNFKGTWLWIAQTVLHFFLLC
jgi:hypothetical protein